jgi:F-type H+-transporting ATPase subunit c
LGKAVAAAMDATGRQPEAATKILINMAVGCAFIEALTIYALVFVFGLSGKI